MSFLKSVLFVSVLSVLLPAIASEAHGEEREVKKIEWQNANPKDGVWEYAAGEKGKRIRILTLKNPGIKESAYAIKGEVSYEDVKEKGFLEMWNYFPDGGYFFTRTLGGGGPMGALEGSSEWREFVLPFNAQKGSVPNKLEVNIVLPSSGKVKLKSAVMVEYPKKESATKPAKSGTTATPQAAGWWGDRQGGMIGAAIGCLGGLYGTVIGLLVPRGKARRFVLSLMMTTAGSGLVTLMVGLVALALRQPYAVWYPLVLSGGLMGILSAALIPGVKRQYDQIELRRMTAMDAAAL